jgi:hypothetical protein
MGTIKNQPLGDVSGAVGHVVFKQRGSICILTRKPKKYRTPQDPRSVSIRNQLGVISNLSRTINNIDLIKKIWRSEFSGSYTAYHKILSSNYHHFRYSDLAGTPVLTPKPGFRLIDPEVEINSEELIIKTGPISPDSGINISLEKFIVTASIFLIESRLDSKFVTYINSRTGNKLSLETGIPLQLITRFHEGNVLYHEGDSVYKSWSVLITLDEKYNPVHYSEIIPWSTNSIETIADKTMNPDKKLELLSKPAKSYPARSIAKDPLIVSQ